MRARGVQRFSELRECRGYKVPYTVPDVAPLISACPGEGLDARAPGESWQPGKGRSSCIVRELAATGHLGIMPLVTSQAVAGGQPNPGAPVSCLPSADEASLYKPARHGHVVARSMDPAPLIASRDTLGLLSGATDTWSLLLGLREVYGLLLAAWPELSFQPSFEALMEDGFAGQHCAQSLGSWQHLMRTPWPLLGLPAQSAGFGTCGWTCAATPEPMMCDDVQRTRFEDAGQSGAAAIGRGLLSDCYRLCTCFAAASTLADVSALLPHPHTCGASKLDRNREALCSTPRPARIPKLQAIC